MCTIDDDYDDNDIDIVHLRRGSGGLDLDTERLAQPELHVLPPTLRIRLKAETRIYIS